MKTIVLLLLLTVSGLCNAQNDSNQVKIDSSKNIMLLKSGDSIEFYRVSSVHKGKLKLQLKKPGKNYFENFKIYKKILVDSIKNIRLSPELNTYTNRKDETYSFTVGKVIKYKKKELFVYELVTGNCTLYYYDQGIGQDDLHFYRFLVKRKGEQLATEIHGPTSTNPKFKKAGSKYFSDCAEVVKKIKESEVKNKSEYLIPELTRFVELYNSGCSESESR